MTHQTHSGTKIEEAVIAIWSEILALPSVDPYNNFIELGGHSLLAGQILARVRRDFGVRLKVRDFFENPTAAGLAARIRAASEAAEAVPSRTDAQPGGYR